MTPKTALAVSVEKPTNEKLNALKVFSWPIWTKEVSSFDWYYDENDLDMKKAGEEFSMIVGIPIETILDK